MRTILVKLQKPIFFGGSPKLGVADFRLKGVDRVEVEIDYTRKDGTKSYPDTYTMPASKLTKYPTQIVNGGVRLHVAPLSDWDVK